MDLKIVIKTLLKVFKREGVTVRGTTEVVSFHIYRQAQIDSNKEKYI